MKSEKNKKSPAADRAYSKQNDSAHNISFSPEEISHYYAARVPDLKQVASGEWRGPCPIHFGQRDSFAVNSATGDWFCHSECGRGGSVIGLEMALTDADAKKAKAEVFRMVGRTASSTASKPATGPMEIPADARALLDKKIEMYAKQKGMKHVATYEFRHPDESLAYMKAKFKQSSGEKTFQKYALTTDGKWTTPKAAGIPPLLYNLHLLADADEIHLCNGEKAANAGYKLGLVTTCLPDGEAKWDPAFTPHLKGKRVVAYLDNDEVGKKHGQVVIKELFGQVSELRIVNLPTLPPKGDLYDWIKAGGKLKELRNIIDGTPVVVALPTPAPPTVRFVDEAPLVLTRPLDLIKGRAYAATWVWVEREVTEVFDADGNIVRCDPPQITKSYELVIVRDDGEIFGAGKNPLTSLGIRVELDEPPREEKLWRAAGLTAFNERKLPNAKKLFSTIAAVFDHFLDFARSIGEQSTMCEFSACAVLVTWFAAAFSVLGYFWPNGEKGSGKTKWGQCWALMSYLGEVLLASGSFAALRDLANYGGTMMFDDAESLADPKQVDPNKRELMLAGNRRNLKVPLKEQISGRWVIRWVNAYCPRAFTAIKTPDPVLASRTIAIPLVRTANPAKGNADPEDTSRWPCNYLQLMDDLWATALSLMPEAATTWAEFDDEKSVVGREFEPWRGILVVARLFERHGFDDLEQRMRDLMDNYRKERPDVMGEDHTVLVIRALLELADIKDVSDMSDMDNSSMLSVSASKVVSALNGFAEEDASLESEWMKPRTVGRILSRLRLRRGRESNKNRDRRWNITHSDLVGLARAYGVMPPEDANGEHSTTSKPNGQDSDVQNGQNVPKCPT